MCLGCPEMPMQILPQAPVGRRERPGRRGGRRADGNKPIPGRATASNRRLNRSNTGQRWAPSWDLLRPSCPPPPRDLPVSRGVRPRGTPLLPLAPEWGGCSGHLLPFAWKGISACFFFPAVSSSVRPRNLASALHSKTPTDGVVKITFRIWKNLLMPREYHLKLLWNIPWVFNWSKQSATNPNSNMIALRLGSNCLRFRWNLQAKAYKNNLNFTIILSKAKRWEPTRFLTSHF